MSLKETIFEFINALETTIVSKLPKTHIKVYSVIPKEISDLEDFCETIWLPRFLEYQKESALDV